MGKKKVKTSSTETSHAVTTPNNPEWVTSGAQGLAGQIQKLGASDPASFVAPLSQLEQQAAQGAAGLSGARDGSGTGVGSDAWFSKLMNGAAPSVGSASLLDNLEAYQTPYRHQVVEATLADFDADAARTRASQDLAMAGQGAFGGSGAALTKSLTEGELARARNTKLADLLSGMFTTGATLSNMDADRRQQASIANAQFALQDAQAKQQLAQFQAQYGLDRDANSRANIASQATLGQQLRAVDQATRSAPLTSLGQQVEMFSGLPLSLFQGQTVNSNGSRQGTETTSGATWGEILGAAAQVAAAAV